MAGKRKGTEDDRHLWPEMLRAIREIQPRFVVGENVPGLVNWDGGLVFEQVQVDLETEGYQVQTFILPACGVNAPHRRDRVWFVANAKNNGYSGGIEQREKNNIKQRDIYEHTGIGRNEIWPKLERFSEGKTTPHPGLLRPEIRQLDTMGVDELCEQRDVADTPGTGCETERKFTIPTAQNKRISDMRGGWDRFPTQPPVRCGNDELSGIVVRNINPEIYEQISKRYTDKDLQEVWEAIQPEDVQRQIRGLYKIHEPGILFQVLQLCSPTNTDEKGVSAFSEIASEKLLRKLRKYGTFANSPQGRELEKQFRNQFGDTLPYLSYEIALVAMEVERRAKAFATWHRNESIKGYGNAIVPEVVYQIFKAIEHYDHRNP